MAVEIVLDNVRLRPTENRVRIFDLEALGLQTWDGMRLIVRPNGNPPFTDVQLDAIRAMFKVEDGPTENGPWTIREWIPVVGPIDTESGPRTYDRFIRATITSETDNRVTLTRTLPS